MRGIGIDYGSRRIGVAVSDESGKVAFPSVVLPNNKDAVSDVSAFAREQGAKFIVVGESKQYSGIDNSLMKDISVFVNNLKTESKVPVYTHTEVLTTKQAERIQGVENPKKDASAAALILQSYLDVQSSKKGYDNN